MKKEFLLPIFAVLIIIATVIYLIANFPHGDKVVGAIGFFASTSILVWCVISIFAFGRLPFENVDKRIHNIKREKQ